MKVAFDRFAVWGLFALALFWAANASWVFVQALDRSPPESNISGVVTGDLRPGGEFQVSWTWDQDRTGCDWDASPYLIDAAGQEVRYQLIDGTPATAPDRSPPPRQFTTGMRKIPSYVTPGPARYFLKTSAVCSRGQRENPIIFDFGPAFFEILPLEDGK